MSSKTILHHLFDRRETCAELPAIQFKDQGRWVSYNWREYTSLVEAFGAALVERGVARGDRVVIISDTRPEWIIADLAIMGIGAVTVPIYPNNTVEDMQFIIQNSEATTVVLEDARQIEKWKKISPLISTVKYVVAIKKSPEDADEAPSDIWAWSRMLEVGRERLKQEPRLFFDLARAAKVDELATLVYTSGTTGTPKGTIICHEQIMSEVSDAFAIVAVNAEDTTLTFLPYSHILGRLEAWGNVYAGYLLAFAESIEKIRDNLLEVKPTFMIAVPRIFEKIYAGLLAQIENNRTKKQLFDRAFAIGQRVSEAEQNQRRLNLALLLEHKAADAFVFSRIRKGMGGRLRFAVSGGAPLSPEIARFFHGVGLLICEGYGLTETTAGIAFNTPIHYKIGTVGRPIGDVQVRIAEDGEILVKSKKVMKGYYKNDEATRDVFVGGSTDGYFKTGDIGVIDEDGFLRITDRKKDLIKTANGKYVAPQRLENLLKTNPYVSNVLIHGDQKKFIVALITLNPGIIKKFAAEHGITFQNMAELVKARQVHDLVKNIVAEANSHLASHESIKKFAVLPHDFSIESGELTPSLKVKRKICDDKYRAEIDALYS